uniref:NAC transcription factor 92 n=1 Tax=Litchi chinensis TaxID=151069 RepID=A0A8K1HZG1_LITCN|nr:NAC transcription factor 92 [Litchi chinensis]
MASSVPVGHKFLPSDKQLVGYYLFNKIFTQTPPFCDHEKSLVKDFDLYSSLEPWEISQLHGGDDLEDDQALYFFTPLKKVSANGSRICRRVGSGTWGREDSGDKIKAENVDGLQKRFRCENRHSPHDGAWIMHEFAIHSVLLGQQQKPYDIVLCRLKNNMRGSDKKRKSKDDNFEQSKRCKFTLSSTIEAESIAGEPDRLLDVQDNMLQPAQITIGLKLKMACLLSTVISSSPLGVDGDDCFWENIMKLLPSLNHDDMMPTATCFNLTDAGDSENVVDAHRNMLHPPITTTQAEADRLQFVVSSSPRNVDGDDCSRENMMKDIPLPDPDDMIYTHSSDVSDFWDFEVS